MDDMRALTRLMKELEEQLVLCISCGLCQAVCPLYAVTGREADVARGKLALLDGLMREMFDNPQGVWERLNRCLLCGSCAAGCPSGVSALEIFLKARAILAGYMGMSPGKRLLLRGMLAHPTLFDRITEWGARFQKVFTKEVDEVLGTSCARISSPLIGDRHFRPLAERPFHARRRPQMRASKDSQTAVGLFVGCLIDKVFPEIAEDTLKVLEHHRIPVFLPGEQGCCGIPALSSGDMATFLRLVRFNLDRFEEGPFDVLITSCATCASTIKKMWPVMTRSDAALHARVLRMSEKTMDIDQFLVSRVGVRAAPAREEGGTCVTYHDPCHLKKSLGVWKEPRELIQADPRIRLVEMPEADTCCGMGGSFNLQYYELSARIGERKRDRILSTGCGIVATACPACMMQLSDMLSKGEAGIRVKHPIQLYAEYLDAT